MSAEVASKVKETTLHSYVEYDAKTERDNNEFRRVVCKVAAWALLIGFSALMIGMAVHTYLYAPSYLPVVLLAMPFLMLITSAAYHILGIVANSYADQVDFNNRLIKKIDDIPTDPTELRELIEKLGIQLRDLDDDELVKTIPVIARAQVLIEDSDKEIKRVHEALSLEEVSLNFEDGERIVNAEKILFENVSRLHSVKGRSRTEIFDKLHERHIQLMNDYQNAVVKRLDAAYCLKVVQNPHERSIPSDFYYLREFDFEQRYRAKAQDDPEWNTLVKMQDKDLAGKLQDLTEEELNRKIHGIPIYTISQVEKTEIAEIATTIFGLNSEPQKE